MIALNRWKPDGRNVGLKPKAAKLGRAASGPSRRLAALQKSAAVESGRSLADPSALLTGHSLSCAGPIRRRETDIFAVAGRLFRSA